MKMETPVVDDVSTEFLDAGRGYEKMFVPAEEMKLTCLP
jgi:hypothetical protein